MKHLNTVYLCAGRFCIQKTRICVVVGVFVIKSLEELVSVQLSEPISTSEKQPYQLKMFAVTGGRKKGF